MSGLARRTDPITSQIAASEVDATKLEYAVIRCLIDTGPTTSDRAAQHMGVDKDSITPRFRPLMNKGMVRQQLDITGGPVTLKSLTSNKRRIVYELTQKGASHCPAQGELHV